MTWTLLIFFCACGGAQKTEEDKAAVEAQKAAAAGTESSKLFEEGKALYAAGDTEGAIAKWEAGHAAKPDPVFQYNLAMAHLKANRQDKAAEHLKTYLEMYPTAPNKAEVEKALADMETAKARDESQKLFESGNQLFRDGKVDEAIADWEAGYAKAPSAAFLYNIGMAHKQAKRWVDAKTYLVRYLEAAPDSPRKAEVEKEIKQLDRKKK
jgi:outer membrane protein assembly factor BamD (BamD/ComL family)